MSTTRITDNDYADVALYDKVNMIANEIDNELSKTVTTNTTQTITSSKTFTGDIVRTDSLDGSGTRTLKTVDTNGKGSTSLVSYYTNEKIYYRLLAENTTAGKSAQIDVIAKDDGTAELQFAGSATDKLVNFTLATKVRVPTAGSSPESFEAVNISYLNSKVANYLPLTGGTITGDLLRKIDMNTSSNPSTTKYIVPFAVDNADSSVRAYQQVKHDTSGKITYTFGLRRLVNGENKFNVIDLETDVAGNAAIKVINPPTSSNGQNIATTSFVKSVLSSTGNGLATFSKAQNGYYKFSNGLIIQWGYEPSGEGVPITLPTPFTSTNYSVTVTSVGNDSEQWARLVNTKTTTSFIMNVGGGASGYAWNWIAIGY